ncbi:hypothetical protein ACLB1N_12720 [Escherichia coli]
MPTIEIAHFLYEHVLQSQLHGIYNLSAAPISKFDLLTLVNEVYKLNKTIVPKSDFVIDRSLDSHRLCSLTKYTPPDWNTLVVKMYLDYLSLGALLNGKDNLSFSKLISEAEINSRNRSHLNLHESFSYSYTENFDLLLFEYVYSSSLS